MTVHLTIWWLWWVLIFVYAVGVLAGMGLTTIADDVWWWVRPLIIVWPAALAGVALWRTARFMAGKD